MGDNGRAVAVRSPGLQLAGLPDVLKFAQVLAQSSLFPDCASAAQAVVKIVAGMELGFGPMASMTGIHFMDGNPRVGAHLMAAMIRGSGRYDFRVHETTRERCEVEFFLKEGGTRQSLGRLALTLQEARDHGYTVIKGGQNKGKELPAWKDRSHDMLFADVIRQGFRRFCPDLTYGVDVGAADLDGVEPAPQVAAVVARPALPDNTNAAPDADPGGSCRRDSVQALFTEAAGVFEQAVGPVYVSDEQLSRIEQLCRDLKVTPQQVEAKCVQLKVDHFRQLTPAQADELEAGLDRKSVV